MSGPKEKWLFITGRLAESSLRAVLAEVAPRAGFEYDVLRLNIAVAALMTPAWAARKLAATAPPDPQGWTAYARVILPGFCDGPPEDMAALRAAVGERPVALGPRDLRDLPLYLGQSATATVPGATPVNITIVAEINEAPRLERAALLAAAANLAAQGADIIDIGCLPGPPWPGLPDAVRAMRGAGYRVSVDSVNPVEIIAAVEAGAEAVLSVTPANAALVARQAKAINPGVELVAIAESPDDLDGLVRLGETLANWGVTHRLDPVLEPIGLGFAASLERYITLRKRCPAALMMMGVGNLTELTGVDSAGINVLLAGLCEELAIDWVLTTAVANWARTSVAELDLARRLVAQAVGGRVLPKYRQPNLHVLRDAKPRPFGEDTLHAMAAATTDRNYRIFAEGGRIHIFNRDMFVSGADAFELFEEVQRRAGAGAIDPGHAFYLGYEMAKAITALTLHKSYRQDQALNWGYLTVPELSHRAKRRGNSSLETTKPDGVAESGKPL